MAGDNPSASSRALWQAAWRKVCFNVDGIAIGTTIAALASSGILHALADAREPVPVDTLAGRFDARPGYLHLAMRLLSGQGFIHYQACDSGRVHAALTADGMSLLPALPAYRQMPALLQAAADFHDVLHGNRPPSPEMIGCLEESLAPPQLETLPATLKQRVHCHILGPGVAVSSHALLQAGMPDARGGLPAVPGDVHRLALRLLAAQGWSEADGDGFALTREGRLVPAVRAQYSMALAYLPTFMGVSRLLFADGAAMQPDALPDEKLDRHLDIEISGDVFSRHCRKPLLDVALPLFDREPLAEQPRVIVDTGCGDGTMLRDLYLAIRDGTLRGQVLDRHPLLAVGTDPSPIARQVTAEALARAGVPYLVVHGDIAEPEQLASELAAHGVDMHEALHMSKSVIHNRRYRPPQDAAAAASRRPCSHALFVARDGMPVPPRLMEQNLMELFRAWLPWARRHGMIVIEAHAVGPDAIRAHLGESVITMLEASHGYSNQNLIDAGCHRALAREAEFVALSSRDLLAVGGRPLLTLDYMLPLEGLGLGMLPA